MNESSSGRRSGLEIQIWRRLRYRSGYREDFKAKLSSGHPALRLGRRKGAREIGDLGMVSWKPGEEKTPGGGSYQPQHIGRLSEMWTGC